MAIAKSVTVPVRRFQISENNMGLVPWSVAEIVDGRIRILGDVSKWTAAGVPITADRIGIITVEASTFEMAGGCATFGPAARARGG
jgi:hypothetical protein